METMQTARLETEYVMTLLAQMEPQQRIDETLSIFNVTGGWVTSDDRYCITAPTFRTSHPKYAWLDCNSGYWQVY